MALIWSAFIVKVPFKGVNEQLVQRFDGIRCNPGFSLSLSVGDFDNIIAEADLEDANLHSQALDVLRNDFVFRHDRLFHCLGAGSLLLNR